MSKEKLNMISGKATREGTQRFKNRFVIDEAGGAPYQLSHFRDRGGLWFSSVGIGSYLGNPDDGLAIRRIFDLFVDGLSPWAIAEQLDADGVPTTKGGRWNAGTLWWILKNPAYAGTYRRGEIVIPNNHPFLYLILL